MKSIAFMSNHPVDITEELSELPPPLQPKLNPANCGVFAGLNILPFTLGLLLVFFPPLPPLMLFNCLNLPPIVQTGIDLIAE